MLGELIFSQLNLHCPARFRRRPSGADDSLLIPYVRMEVVFSRCLLDVAKNGWSIGDGFGISPGFEDVAHGVHIAI